MALNGERRPVCCQYGSRACRVAHAEHTELPGCKRSETPIGCRVRCARAEPYPVRVRRYKAHREPVQIAAQLALSAAAVGLLTWPLASTLQGGASGSMAWFARCVFAEMLGSHAIMFVVRPALLRCTPGLGRPVRPPKVAAGAFQLCGLFRGHCVRVECF